MCLWFPLRALLHLLPNSTLTLTFKRPTRPPWPQLVSFPLLGLQKVRIGFALRAEPQRLLSCFIKQRQLALCAFSSVTSIQPWHSAQPLPLCFPRSFCRKAAWVAVLSCQDLFVVPLWVPCPFLSVSNHALPPSDPMPTLIVNFCSNI